MEQNVQSPSVEVAESQPIEDNVASPIAFPKFPMPNFEFSKFEILASFGDFAAKSASEAKEACEKMKSATDQIMGRLEEIRTTATRGANEYSLQLLEASRAHANAAFDCATKLVSAKSLLEWVEFSAAHAREQLNILTEQSTKLSSLSRKIANETAEVVRRDVPEIVRRAA